eukprot:275863_1
MVHENIGSNSSLDDGVPHVTYTTNLNSGGSKLKRKRNNNKVSRSQSVYSTTYINGIKSELIDTLWNHDRIQLYDIINTQWRSITDEAIHHPAHHKYMRK